MRTIPGNEYLPFERRAAVYQGSVDLRGIHVLHDVFGTESAVFAGLGELEVG